MHLFGTRSDKMVVQMMYVSGETAEASTETTGMIEEIVRQQVIEMVCV
jgi:transcription initiation protein SPT3